MLEDSLMEGSPLECSICLERMEEVSFLTTKPDIFGNVCNHWFCTKCIEPLVSNAKENGKEALCPSCRRTVLSVTRSRAANELIREVMQERDLRKKMATEKDDAEKQLKKNRKSNKALKEELEQLRKEFDKQQSEVIKLRESHNQDIIVLTTLKNKYQTIQLENKTLQDEKLKSEQLEQQLKEVEKQFQKEKEELVIRYEKQCRILEDQLLDEKTKTINIENQLVKNVKEIQQNESQFKSIIASLEKQLEEKTAAAEKWQKLHRKAVEDQFVNKPLHYTSENSISSPSVMSYHHNINNNSATIRHSTGGNVTSSLTSSNNNNNNSHLDSPSSSTSGYLGGWITPKSIDKISNSLSYLGWTSSRSGPLVHNNSHFVFLERRGSNRNSSVWRAQFKAKTVSSSNLNLRTSSGANPPHSQSFVALKKLRSLQKNAISAADRWREAMFLHKFEHHNILKLEGVLRDASVPGTNQTADYMILPYMEFDLEYLLSDSTNFHLDEQRTRFIMYQLLSAVYYLHSGDVIHLDIKPTSILLNETNHLKLGSFFYSRSLRSPLNAVVFSSLSSSSLNRYGAIETFFAHSDAALNQPRSDRYYKGADIWSIGCIFAELLTGVPLFDGKDKNALLSRIFSFSECKPSTIEISRFPILNTVTIPSTTSSLRDWFRERNIQIPTLAFDLLQKMLVFDPENRISAEEALNHKYFAGASYVKVNRTCPLGGELTDTDVTNFVETKCGGAP